jgi:hypothetical protein
VRAQQLAEFRVERSRVFPEKLEVGHDLDDEVEVDVLEKKKKLTDCNTFSLRIGNPYV